ncbi:hypothetical protein [Stenotrophomonas sepilia]
MYAVRNEPDALSAVLDSARNALAAREANRMVPQGDLVSLAVAIA